MSEPTKELFLLDASPYFFRAWFGLPDIYEDEQGHSVNGTYGYFRLLLRRLREQSPDYMVAAFDESLFSGFRHQLYPGYKANRALPDDNLRLQLEYAKQLTSLLGITPLADRVYEADDWLAWGAKLGRKQGCRLQVISTDKDLAQLVERSDQMLDWWQGAKLDFDQLSETWLSCPQKIPDILALAGDRSDNIPGVTGIGLVTARQVMSHFDSLEDLYRNLATLEQLPLRGPERLRQRLESDQEQAFLFRELVRLRPPQKNLRFSSLKYRPVTATTLSAGIAALGLGPAFQQLVDRIWRKNSAGQSSA